MPKVQRPDDCMAIDALHVIRSCACTCPGTCTAACLRCQIINLTQVWPLCAAQWRLVTGITLSDGLSVRGSS